MLHICIIVCNMICIFIVKIFIFNIFIFKIFIFNILIFNTFISIYLCSIYSHSIYLSIYNIFIYNIFTCQIIIYHIHIYIYIFIYMGPVPGSPHPQWYGPPNSTPVNRPFVRPKTRTSWLTTHCMPFCYIFASYRLYTQSVSMHK